jgi:hypothetical protein
MTIARRLTPLERSTYGIGVVELITPLNVKSTFA